MNRAQEAAREPAGRAAFGWYGSKARLAPKVAALAAGIPHRVYVEAYAGSAADVAAEGFPQMTPAQFVSFFCRAHRGCGPGAEVTRIEWRYLG